MAETINYFQDDGFLRLALAKDARLVNLKAHFQRNGLRKVCLDRRLAPHRDAIPEMEMAILEDADLLSRDLAESKSRLDGCVLIVNNNTVTDREMLAAYSRLFNACTETCFVAWDYDNHHGLDLSAILAAHSDLYVPAHHENLYLLSRYNSMLAGPTYCASGQWPAPMLAESMPRMLSAPRSREPLGRHQPYGRFSYRQRVVTTLNQRYPSIGFSNPAYDIRSAEDRLAEWIGHTCHWIVPVLNDVPIRIFDALITGGIPIVPASLRFLPPIAGIPRQHIEFYTPTDILDPVAVVDRANRLFEQGGPECIMARHRYAMENHHVGCRIQDMLQYAADMLGIPAARPTDSA